MFARGLQIYYMKDSATGIFLGTLQRTCFYPGFTVFSKRKSVAFMKGFILNKGTEKYLISKDIIIKMNVKVNTVNKTANNVSNQFF